MYFQRRPLKVYLKIVAVLWAATVLSVLCGCLETPSSPDTSKKLEYLRVFSFQEGIEDSTLLKIHPGKAATLQADTYPHQYKKEISFQWKLDSKVLGQGEKFSISESATAEQIPNTLVATDAYGNSCTYEFNLIVNTPPQIGSVTKPTQGDTLYGNRNTALYFQWTSSDKDQSRGDQIQHTLIIDGTSYEVGELTHVYQAGFSAGRHSFRVIVTDSYGDSDTLKTVNFIVLNPAEAYP